MAEEALDALSSSRIRHVRVLGRRGPLQASFTTKELRAMLSIPRTRVELVPLDAADGMSSEDRSISRLLQVMQQFPHQQSDYDKRLSIEFYTSPQRFLGKERVEGLQARQTVVDVNGRVQLTDRVDTLACQLAVKSIGYACEPVGGVPWDAEHSVVPNDHGRVLSEGSPVPGLFVAGWLKRGPKGVINTTMVDAWETADAILSDTLPQPHTDPKDLVLHNRVFTFDDWLKLDAWENEQGTCMGKVRTKITSMDDMLRLLNRI
jgi:NADPH-dependent glutamate synthase beta subunit-like oxidoreductase